MQSNLDNYTASDFKLTGFQLLSCKIRSYLKFDILMAYELKKIYIIIIALF